MIISWSNVTKPPILWFVLFIWSPVFAPTVVSKKKDLTIHKQRLCVLYSSQLQCSYKSFSHPSFLQMYGWSDVTVKPYYLIFRCMTFFENCFLLTNCALLDPGQRAEEAFCSVSNPSLLLLELVCNWASGFSYFDWYLTDGRSHCIVCSRLCSLFLRPRRLQLKPWSKVMWDITRLTYESVHCFVAWDITMVSAFQQLPYIHKNNRTETNSCYRRF